MARARVKQLQTPRIILLELTEGEADFILGLVAGFIAGHPRKSPRKYAARIQEALGKIAGYGYRETDSYKLGTGRVQFVPYGSVRSTSAERIAANPAKRSRPVENVHSDLLGSGRSRRSGDGRRKRT